jgi:SAM-dependent methyltransferase
MRPVNHAPWITLRAAAKQRRAARAGTTLSLRMSDQPRMYHDLAPWFHLLTAPASYREEAAHALHLLTEACDAAPRTLLELGSGGGNNASHLKQHVALTLVDLSPEMLAVSRELNPDCEHVPGDMRGVRLGRTFDAVFVHDAIMYMTTDDDLLATMETAFVHCRPGGSALFTPDHVRETYESATRHGGHDGKGRSLRYLEWDWDPNPSDTMTEVQYALVLREHDGSTRVEHDRHVRGLFSRGTWLALLREAGFEAKSVVDPWEREVFIAKRPLGP